MENQAKDLVTKNQSTELSNPNNLGMGHEIRPDMDDEIEMPRALLVQATSAQAMAERPEDRVAVGLIINNITNKQLSKNFIPIMRLPSTYTRWNPRKKDDPHFDSAYDPGQMIFTTTNKYDERIGRDGLSFGPKGESPRVTHYINFLAYFIGENSPVLLSFAKTSYKAGQRLNTSLISAGGNMFDWQFILRSAQREQAGTKFFALEIVGDGKPSEKEHLKAKSFYDIYKHKTIVVNPLDDQDTTGSVAKENAHTAVGAGDNPEDWKD